MHLSSCLDRIHLFTPKTLSLMWRCLSAFQVKIQIGTLFQLKNIFIKRLKICRMLALQRQLTRRSALLVISRFTSTDSSLVEAWEAKARKEAKGKDPYEAFGSKNHDVGAISTHATYCIPRSSFNCKIYFFRNH